MKATSEGVGLSLMRNLIIDLDFHEVIHVNICDLLKVAIDSAQTNDERDKLQMELATHQEKAPQGYQSLRLDSEKSKGDADSLVLTFDLRRTYLCQHLLMVPCFT